MNKLIFQLIGIALMLLGVYLLGKNIFFTTNTSPYFWRGIAADISVVALTLGVISIFMFPKTMKITGFVLIGFGVVFVVYSSRAVLSPTSLWQFLLSISSMVGGFKLLTDKRFGG
ncbi:hypothetical protein [Cyanobacterium aponinum]|uniref:hypothetical protein n=1 Tax=Cyanobacterium aponinum TaxID=379064 RepID=UPI000C12ADA6|nr:hypothetical protein [Cyanobacterium aponinum]PHV62737.1 hypothetical protein CSQ80_09190 [Cyanobacterium aponinum IPPAS B-1201]